MDTRSRQDALRACIREMAEQGIPAFVDRSGREWTPEAYINMDIRTTVSNTAHAAQFARMDEYGVDLVAVSSHVGARPLCAKDQGKLFSRSNKSGYTTDLHGKRIRYYPWSCSSFGKPARLLGINCGHHIYPFIPGLSRQSYEQYDKDENDEAYQLSQKQRYSERQVRKAKRECMMLDAAGDKEGFRQAPVLQVTDAASRLNLAPKPITQEELQRDYNYHRAQKTAETMLELGLISLSEFNDLTRLDRETFSPFFVELLPEIG